MARRSHQLSLALLPPSEKRFFHYHLRDRQIQFAFWGALLFGVLVHGMTLFNKLSHHDDIFALFWTGSTISSGRWMLHVLGSLETSFFGDGNFSLPLMSGLFSLLCVAAAAVLLTDLLKIRRPLLCLLLGCVLVSFPVITGFFSYLFTMPYYLLAMVMMVFSAFLICRSRGWIGRILAVILAGCSLGTYQAFLPLLLSVSLLYDLRMLSEGEKLSDFWKRAVLQVLCTVASLVFYFAMNRFFLAKFQLELNTYMGLDRMESTPLGDYLLRAGTAYREFFLPTRNVSADMYPMHLYYVSRLMLLLDAVLGLRMVIGAAGKEKGRAALLVLLFLLFPLANNFIYVMSENVHGLMTYGLAAQFALFVFLVDRAELRLPSLQKAFAGFAAVLMGLSGWMYARFDNQCYLKAVFQQQQAISFFTTLAAQIRSAEGYRDELPVIFLNEEHISDQTLYNIDELDFIRLDAYGDDITSYLNSYAWRAFMERWCGFSPVSPEGGSFAVPETTAMPHYPDDGSIRVFDDFVLVNF